jgi:hypothetical protein
MSGAPKYILHCPITDESSLDAFVEQCLAEKVSLLAIFGPDSRRIEDIVDEIIVGDGSNEDRFICTTSHPDETFEDVLGFVRIHDQEQVGKIIHARL